MGTLIMTLVVLANGAELSPEALVQYQKANAALGAGQFGAAIEGYNALAAEYPRVAEVFAGRCSASVGLKHYAVAEADCVYALALKPQLPAATYALAMAEEFQGKRDAAITHYRQYAALDPKLAPAGPAAATRADALSAAPSNVPAPPPLVTASAPVAGGTNMLVVYHNHFASFSRVTLVLDGKLVGDLSMNEFVEINAAAGEHLLEARTNPVSAYETPRVWSHPFRLSASPVYANFDSNGGQMTLQEVPSRQAVTEIRADCKKAYAREIGPDSIQAPPVPAARAVVMAPAVNPWPGSGVGATTVIIGPGAQSCRFSSDCGDSSDFSCRDWHGQRVCMGFGGPGAPCWFSSDCLSSSCDGSQKVCR